ncbi:MAG: hypothetical protein J7518_12980 [Nocardioidaceae bacterium]|nr:hypothetical protein [Nocardioidaceae bacterium]
MIRFVVFLLLLAVALYGVFWAIDRRNNNGSGPSSRPSPRGPVGPDDDESFLRDLERRRHNPTDRHPPDRPENPGDS